MGQAARRIPGDLNAGSYTAYGVNWIFGDTLSNYVSGQTEGYVVSSPQATVIPTPSAALAGLAMLGVVAMRRRRNA